MDLGSDGLAACSALEYKWQANVQMRPDPSHGGTCDFDGALGVAQLKGFWMTMVISWNLPHGIHQEETRSHQLKETMAQCFLKNQNPDLPLFISMSPRIHDNFVQQGHSFQESQDLEQQLWRLMQQRPWFTSMGRKCCMARFHSALHTAMEKVPSWWLDCFER
eukprot:5455550-Lingulodinium_polyedra.AAC.1